eukprot:695406-Pleurochrysis_carterae.AAC.2
MSLVTVRSGWREGPGGGKRARATVAQSQAASRCRAVPAWGCQGNTCTTVKTLLSCYTWRFSFPCETVISRNLRNDADDIGRNFLLSNERLDENVLRAPRVPSTPPAGARKTQPRAESVADQTTRNVRQFVISARHHGLRIYEYRVPINSSYKYTH